MLLEGREGGREADLVDKQTVIRNSNPTPLAT